MKLRIKFIIVYILLGSLWIITSDRIIEQFTDDTELLSNIQSYKGILYVLLTGIVFYILLTIELKKRIGLITNLNETNIRLEQEIKEKEIALVKAEENDKLKSAFLCNISHELRTPMNGIAGFCELIQHDNPDNETKIEYIDYINKSSKQLLALMTDIIDVSKIQSGQLEIQNQTFDLHELLENVYNKYESAYANKKLDLYLKKEITEGPLLINTDKSRLIQVFDKLLSNSLAYTESGQVVFGYSKIENDTIHLFVEDTGCGIPADAIGKIFDVFTRFNSNEISQFSGSGLGLSICKGIIENLHGEIFIDSEKNKGTCVNFTLPIGKNYQSELPKQGIPVFNTLKNVWAGKTILIAEDDELNTLLLQSFLKDTGAELRFAKNGKEVLEEFIRNPKIDLVLMDLNMPIINGFEAFEQIRIIYGNVPVIAQTAYTDQNEQQQCINHGFNDFITKPIERKLLLNAISKAFPSN